MNYQYITLRENPAIIYTAAEWFHGKWRVPTEAYLACMSDYLYGKTEFGWYLCLDGEKIYEIHNSSSAKKYFNFAK